MTDGDTSRLIYALIVLVIVASGLFARRLPLGQTVKYVLAWVGIFAIGFVLFSFRGEAGRVWQRLSADFRPNDPQVQDGTVRITRGEDGHFHVNADVNGHEVRFLIDSGATTTAMTASAATSAGVETAVNDFPVMIDTANGSTEAKRARIKSFSVGPINRADFPVLVSDSFGDTNMLGMNFLDTLKGWRVEGETMILNP
jgi:aspartyl protease family protein